MSDSAVQPMLQWLPDYAVGVPQIDQEHQRLFALADRMHRAMLEGKGREQLDALLASLVDYAWDHFAHEERLMERIGYPELNDHRKQHADLQSEVRAMQDRAASGQEEAGAPDGAMPAKVSDSERAMVTAGLANDVDAVNQ